MLINEFRNKAQGFSDLLTYACMIDNGIILGKDGSLTAGFYFRGPDTQSSSDNDLNVIASRLNNAFMLLDGGWVVSIDCIKKTLQNYPTKNFFSNATSKIIDAERSVRYKNEHNHFETVYALTLTYTPPLSIEAGLANMMFDSDVIEKDLGEKALKDFKVKIGDFMSMLSNVFENTVRQMLDYEYQDEQGKIHTRSELLSYINYCISGKAHPVNLPVVPMYLDAILAYDFKGGVEPQIDEKHIKVVAINGLPQQSYPTMLDDLNSLGFEFRWNTRFVVIDQNTAKAKIDDVFKKWKQKIRGFKDVMLNNNNGRIDQNAVVQRDDAEQALSDAQTGLVKYGYYTSVIVLTHENKEILDQNAREVIKIISSKGFVARVETMNSIEAYLGSLPAMGYFNIRKPMLHTLNLAHLIPTTGIWTGVDRNPCDLYDKYYKANKIDSDELPPLAYSATTGKAPFRLSLHYQDLGHTLVVGPTGAGKSVLLSFLMAQHQRYYNAQIFAFDKGYSSFTLNQACGGEYYDIGGDNTSIGFQPLAHIDKDSELTWAVDYILDILRLKGAKVTPNVEQAVLEQMKLLSVQDKEHRTMSNFVNSLRSKVSEIAEYLNYYTLENPGEILDSVNENIKSNPFQVFEMEHLMGKNKDVATPVLLYIFHLIERRLDGRPTLLVLDEAWQLLNDVVFREKIKEWLKVLRKSNVAVVFATQSLSDIDKSPIRDVLYESCPTKILLANPDAKSNESVQNAYMNLGLTEHQIQLLAMTEKKRHYYYVSPLGKRLIEFGFGRVALSFIAVSDKERLKQVRELIKEYGANWPAEWLRLNNLGDWAKYWQEQQ